VDCSAVQIHYRLFFEAPTPSEVSGIFLNPLELIGKEATQ
jgi:hypothetical protein